MSEYDWVDDLAVEAFNDATLAGLAVGVVRGGELVHAVSLGLADIAARRPVSTGTVFRIGSISKTMTAIGVVQLAEEGMLGLDDPVNEHLQRVRVAHADSSVPPVTIRHLLTHTAGVGELRRWSDLFRPTIGLAAPLDGPAPDLDTYYASGLRAELPPGEKWSYANHGFAVLGQLVEDVSGQPFAERMRERLFEPLGMTRTDYRRSARLRADLAVGYQLRFGRLKPVKDREIVVEPAGSVFSCVEDMARYVAAMLDGGGGVIAPERLAEMLEPQAGETDPRLAAMGLAFMLDRVGEKRVAVHDGGWPGFISAMAFVPEEGVGVVSFTNTSAPHAPHTVTDKVLRRLLGVDDDGPARRPVAESPHLWPELVGVYKPLRGLNTNFRLWPLLGGEVEVLVKRGHLTVRAPSPVPQLRKGLRLHAADAGDPLFFELRHEDFVLPVLFRRGAGGAVDSVRTGSTRGGFVELYRRPRATSLGLWARGGLATAGALGVGVAAKRLAAARRRRTA